MSSYAAALHLVFLIHVQNNIIAQDPTIQQQSTEALVTLHRRDVT